LKRYLTTRVRNLLKISVFTLLFVVGSVLYAQQPGTLTGTVQDPRGAALPSAAVLVKNDSSSVTRQATTDAQGHFTVSNLQAGKYTVQVTAAGFEVTNKTGVDVTAGQPQDVTIALTLGNVAQQVTVEAASSGSIASALAPMDALLDARSPRTEITTAYIQNFTSPMADFGELVAMSPSAVTTSSDGVGLGQSKTSFRGFSDGSFDVDYDGIPFYDTNTPSHHSWAFFPSQWVGGVDFDRSPGTASTIGPTPFGGSIHLLSRDMSPVQNVRGSFSYGSFNTYLYDGEYDSGAFGGANKKANVFVDVHHMQSDGYQTLNDNTRNAGSIKVQYKVSNRTVITGFSGVVWLDSNGPNIASTRSQLLANGPNYLLQNTDPTQANYQAYNTYHVPTDFEYVGINSELSHGWRVEVKPYTYNYDNSEFYGKQPKKNAPINPANCAPIPTAVKEGTTTITTVTVLISPCAVDKYNSYRKYGETTVVSKALAFGVFRTGMWYEWALTNRHQFPSNPFTHVDDLLSNFNETFWTNSYQPYAELEFHITRKLTFTPGVKFAYFTQDFKQYADNGGKIGSVNPITGVPFVFVANSVDYHKWLPSGDLNYRLKSNWSIYGQVATGTVVPPSSVYDTAGGLVGTPPKPQSSTTYQTGTVLKLKHVTFDADYYHIRFQNGYSSAIDNNPSDPLFGESINYVAPSSITTGVEFESNIYIARGLSIYLNATKGSATYVGSLSAAAAVTVPAGVPATIPVQAPSGLWVSETPSDTEAEGVTYQRGTWDLGIFNKRVGSQWEDSGAYHNQVRDDPFSVTNAFINYTIRSNSRFDQTKFRLSVNNLWNSHYEYSDTPGGPLVVGPAIPANGITYVNPFAASTTASPGYTDGRNLADNPNLLAGRSIMLTVTFGISPKR
jgi:iron complex outermembrane receptor protein